MKKIFHILLLFTAVFFTGCEEREEIDHPIAGHTYCFYTDTDSGYYISYIEFHSNGDFTWSFVEHNRYLGDESGRYTQMLWSVEGNKITVINNYHSIFDDPYGTVEYTGFYNPVDSTVTLRGLGGKGIATVYEFLE